MHNWDDFRYFHAVARLGSLSKAAKELGVNHSTVSRRIQALEKQHGVRLLERTPSGYNLTSAGASVFEIVESVSESVLKASRVLQGQDSRLEGKIDLTMPLDIFNSCMVKPLKQFVDQNPAIELNLHVSHGVRNLANREADLAIRLTPRPPEYLIGKCITQIQHGIYMHRDLSWNDQTPIIVWQGDTEIPQWAKENFKNPKISLRVDDLASMYNSIKTKFGVARLPCFYPDLNQDQHEIARLPIEQPRSDWGLWLLNHVDLRNTARINHCKSFLVETLTELAPTFAGQHSQFIKSK